MTTDERPVTPRMQLDTEQRPLSPHLQIYRPQWTSVLSILHRISGLLLSAGTALMVVWLVALAQGEAAYQSMLSFMSLLPVQFALVGWTLALFYHLLNGIRHLFWDAGMLLDLDSARASGWTAAVGSILLTVVIWAGLL